MFLSMVKAGKHFGNLGKMYGEYRFALAPNEQKVWKGFFHHAFIKVPRYYLREYWYVIPLFGSFFPLRSWAISANEKHFRKHPEDYANDE